MNELRRDLPIETGTKLSRRIAIEKRDLPEDEESRDVSVAFASSAPVRRWWGYEVLDMSPGAIRSDYLDNGAPTLLNHREFIGAVQSWSLEREDAAAEQDAVARAILRFSRNPKPSEVLLDVRDGLRTGVSVGYIVHAMRLLETRDDGEDVWLVTDWEPYEITIADVPADVTVGVGRSAPVTDDAPAAPPETEEQSRSIPDPDPVMDTTPTPATASPSRLEGRAATIIDLGIQFGCIERAREFASTDGTVEEFQRALLEERRSAAAKPSATADPGQIGLTKKETRSYSMVRLLRALTNPTDRRAQEAAGFEMECHRAVERAWGAKKGGILVPSEITRAYSDYNTGTSGTDTGDTGGALVPDTLLGNEFIDLLKNEAAVLPLVTLAQWGRGAVSFPRKTSAHTTYWVGEGANVPPSNLATDVVTSTPHTIAARTGVTRMMLNHSTPAAEQMVRQDILEEMALGLDRAVLYGDPDSDANSPRGAAFTTGVQAVSLTSAAAPTFAEMVSMETKVSAANARGAMHYLMGSSTRGALKTTPRFSGGEIPIWEPGQTVNGYPAHVSEQITDGHVFYGAFKEIVVGIWGVLEVIADPYTESAAGTLKITTFQDADVAIRHPEALAMAAEEEGGS